MKQWIVLSIASLASMAGAQHVSQVYNRDTHEPFKLKGSETTTIVKGPMVLQRTDFDFENPYKKPTEASFWFDLDRGAILADFGYWYRNEFAPGVLMDKNKAWFIYTAITSRGEDPGIMTMKSETNYHAQVFPIAEGYDFRLRLDNVGFLESSGDEIVVPKPTFQGRSLDQTVRSTGKEILSPTANGETAVSFAAAKDIEFYAQRHSDGYTYVVGMVRADRATDVSVSGIHNVYWKGARTDKEAYKCFVGRRRGGGAVQVVRETAGGRVRDTKVIHANERGSDAAKLWAHQKVQQDRWTSAAALMKFSLNYQVPSSQTAMLAVPKQEMALYRRKAAEFRRKQLAEARKQRAWQQQRNQNWNSSSGGDPEIRIYAPEAKRVYAVLPDGRTFDLIRAADGFWGGNYDIPADAPEGDYTIQVHIVDQSGRETLKQVVYHVDRTAPVGSVSIENGELTLRSETGLPKVVAVFEGGIEENMVEEAPGSYSVALNGRRPVKVVMVDRAHNIGEVLCSR